MKISLTILLFITGLFAQTGLTIVGGLNMSSVKYNDSDVADAVDVSMKPGLNVGIETMSGPLNLGVAFVQRGAGVEIDFFGEKLEGSDTYNYFSGYILYPFSIQEGLSAFGGFQLGRCISGKSEISFAGESESVDLDASEFAIDYGFLFGIDFMINAEMGVRTSYYLGLADVVSDSGSASNWKNTGIGISLLYKI